MRSTCVCVRVCMHVLVWFLKHRVGPCPVAGDQSKVDPPRTPQRREPRERPRGSTRGPALTFSGSIAVKLNIASLSTRAPGENTSLPFMTVGSDREPLICTGGRCPASQGGREAPPPGRSHAVFSLERRNHGHPCSPCREPPWSFRTRLPPRRGSDDHRPFCRRGLPAPGRQSPWAAACLGGPRCARALEGTRTPQRALGGAADAHTRRQASPPSAHCSSGLRAAGTPLGPQDLTRDLGEESRNDSCWEREPLRHPDRGSPGERPSWGPSASSMASVVFSGNRRCCLVWEAGQLSRSPRQPCGAVASASRNRSFQWAACGVGSRGVSGLSP